MKNTKKAVTLVEALVTLVILTLGLTAVYKIYETSIRTIDGVSSKTQAIQIAREGIEAVENIRDTNWQLFPSNTENCWNVLNYNPNCITDSTTTRINTIVGTQTYILVKDINPSTGADLPATQQSGKWFLISKSGNDYTDETYRKTFLVQTGNEGYFQKYTPISTLPIGKNFTRRIEIFPTDGTTYKNPEYLKFNTSSNTWTIEDDKPGIVVKSIVEWKDMSSSGVRKIELENLMTNYKK